MSDLNWDEYPNFSEAEFACPCCGRAEMRHKFMMSLQGLRDECGFPIFVTSGYRCPDYNDKISSTGRNGPHTTGWACDIAVSLHRSFNLLRLALMGNFTGIGIKQHGKLSGRFLHVDMLALEALRPRVWTYE